MPSPRTPTGGNPKQAPLVADMEQIHRALLEHLWQERQDLPPMDEERWWELWFDPRISPMDPVVTLRGLAGERQPHRDPEDRRRRVEPAGVGRRPAEGAAGVRSRRPAEAARRVPHGVRGVRGQRQEPLRRTQPVTTVHNTQGYLFDAVVRHPVTAVP